MDPISNRRPGGSDGAEPLSAQSSAFDAIGSFPRPTDLVDAEALADMRAFNDLKAKRKKQRKRKIVVGIVSAVAVLAVAGGAFAWYSADQAAKALENMAPQTAFVEQGTFVETVSASGNLQPVASVSATSEVDGIVGEVLVAEGDAVAEGQTLFTVVNDDLDKAVKQAAQGIEEAKNGVAQAQNAVNDAYHAKSAGQQAAARAQEQAQAAAAAAKEAGAATPASDASGASFDAAGGAMYGGMGGAVTYAVKLLIAEPDPRLKPGMTAKATITTTTIENALKVPISAVQSDGAGGSFVMVLTDPETQGTEMREVEVVASDGLTSVVKGRVKAGDEVVVSGGMGGAPDGMGMAVDGAASADSAAVAVG